MNYIAAQSSVPRWSLNHSTGDVDQMLGLADNYLSSVDCVSLEGRVGLQSIEGSQTLDWANPDTLSLRATTLSIPVLHGSLIMDAERLYSDIRSQLQEDPISTEHLKISQTPSGLSIPMVYYATSDASIFQTPAISNYVFSSTHMSIPLQVISVRRRPFIKSACNTIGPDFQSMSRTTANCAPQTLQTSQATSDSQEALELHIHGFHREAPFIFWLHLDSSHC